jgi:diacylglycerol kinase family enzyme
MAARICVIFNPQSGRGRAGRRLERLRQLLGSQAVFWPTELPGHAEELARQAAVTGYAIVAAAGGDGTVHEVANGLVGAGCPEVALAVVPIGSSNDYAKCLGDKNGTASAQLERRVDVGTVRDSRGRLRHFVCCLGLGLNGSVTLESRKIKRLQGLALYGLATLRALWYHYACPPLTVIIDDQPPATMPTLMLSILLAQREGGFVLAPEAQLDDGLFDYVHAAALSRLEVLRYLPRLATLGPPKHHPKVRMGQCRRLLLHSPVPLTVHIDGEFFARPEDDVRDLDIRLLPRALRVQQLLPG